MKRIFSLFLALSLNCFAATTHYVDGNAPGPTHDGSSWTFAWTTLGAMTGLAAGDTVYISGGSSGNTQTYTTAASFTLLSGYANGTTGNPITYQIGQDTSHNGTAIFTATGASGFMYNAWHDVVVSGRYLTGSDGLNHFQVNSGYYSLINNTSGGTVHDATLEYITMSSTGYNQSQITGNGFWIDHCSLTGTDTTAPGIFYIAYSATSSAYGMGGVRNSTLNAPYSSAGFGTDAFKLVGTGFDIYGNTVTGYFLTGANADHQDGWQAGGGSYIRIFNNNWIDMQNYAIFQEPANGGYSHCRYYNNIVRKTGGGGTIAIYIAARKGLGYLNDDVVMANNLCDGFVNPYFFDDQYAGAGSNTFTNCYFYNNTGVTGTGNQINAQVTSATNANVTSGNAATYFTTYSAGSTTNVYILLSAATPLIHTGTDASSFGITTDYTGAAYANPPSIGPYEFGGSSGGGGSSLSGAITLKGGVVLH